jgi:hypothetical protein
MRFRVALLVLCLAGCGGSGSAAPPKPDPASDDKVAAAAVFKLADFPSGFEDTGGGGDEATGCAPIDEARKLATGQDTGARFESQQTAQVQNSAFVFPDEKTALKGYARVANQATTKCLADALTGGISSDPTAEVGGIRTASLAVDAPGDQSEGTRIVAPVASEGRKAEIYVDVVYVRAGRGVILAYFVEAFEPFDEQLRGELLAKLVPRLAA